MKIHILLNLYNDHTFLTAMLESVKNVADSIIVADGAYQLYYEHALEQNPNAKPYSTDGSLEIIQLLHNLPSTRIIKLPNNQPWTNQNAKRTALLEAVPIGDWFIIIDADQMLKGNVKEGLQTIMDSGCIAGRVPQYHAGLDEERLYTFDHPRIFKKVEGMHYRGTHWHLRDHYGRIIEGTYPMKWTDKFVFVHLKAFKDVEKLSMHQGYMDVMAKQGWLEA